jgi:hypothetical protein
MGNLFTVLMVLLVVIVGLGIALAGIYCLDRAVDQPGTSPDQNPAE